MKLRTNKERTYDEWQEYDKTLQGRLEKCREAFQKFITVFCKETGIECTIKKLTQLVS